MRNKIFEEDERPIDAECACYTCRTFTKAYIRHLLHVEEMLGLYLMSLHNLHFLLQLMREIRSAILQDHFTEYASAWLFRYEKNGAI